MLLILSGKSVPEDIAQCFGRLPPSFLPLGGKRLFITQVEAAFGEPCFMTIPMNYEVSSIDQASLEKVGITPILQPPGLSLPQAILRALEKIVPKGPVRILYGDTMVRMTPKEMKEPDTVAIQQTHANYPWAFVEKEPNGNVQFSDDSPRILDSRNVVCGYFNFSDPEVLKLACKEQSIVELLQSYNKKRPLSLREAEEWFDFGHLPLLFQSKKNIQVKRVFNELIYEDHMVIKRSKDTAKMRAEAHWYENLPIPLRLHVPRYGGRREQNYKAGYGVEYLYAPLLSDLSVFGALPFSSWLEIISACFEFIEKCHSIKPPRGTPEASEEFAAHFFQSIVVDKTWARLERYCHGSGISIKDRIEINGSLQPPLNEIIENMLDRISKTKPKHVRFWHGDLFFGNLFYDFTARRVMCIDPRGSLASGEFCLYGDLRYDIAKLAHSVIGQYDSILLGRSNFLEISSNHWQFHIESNDESRYLEQALFAFAEKKCGVKRYELLALTALLFFSMLPLHDDHPEMQKKFLANGLMLAARCELEVAK